MAYTRVEWNQLQRNLPQEDRMSYEQYLEQSKRNFVPVKTIKNQYGESVRVDANGLDASGNLVIAGETPEDTAARAAADRTEVSRSFLGTGKNRMLVIKYSDGTETQTPAPVNELVEEKAPTAAPEQDFTARDAVLAMFENLGLGDEFTRSLMATIDGVYQQSLKPSRAEVMNAVYSSEAYKKRFKANEAIRQRLASGKGMAGDKMLTPAEYIDLEQTYRELMQNVGLPANFYDQPEDFSNFIANGVSPSEVKSRIDLAGEALNKADVNVVNALRDFYGLGREDLVAYLVDPERAVNLFDKRNTLINLQRAYGAAEVGGAARRQGFTSGDILSDRLLSEEIVRMGKQGEAEEAFQMAATMQPDMQRLAGLYGESMDTQDLVRERLALEGGVAAGQKRRKLASKERAMFSQQSAVGRASLSREANL